MSGIAAKIQASRARLTAARADHAAKVRQVAACEQSAESARKRVVALKEAQAVVQQVAHAVQQKAHAAFAGTATLVLSGVFRDPYKVLLDFRQSRGRSEARIQFERGGHIHEPMGATSGGVKAVVSLALRMSAIALQRPAARRVLFLDEPLLGVSAAYREEARNHVVELINQMGFQVVMVTHDQDLWCGYGNLIRFR